MALATGSQHMNLLAPAVSGADCCRRRSKGRSGRDCAERIDSVDHPTRCDRRRQFCAGLHDRCRCGLHRANRLCGLARLRRLSATAAYRCGLHPARHLQRRSGTGCKFIKPDPCATFAGRRTATGAKLQAITGFVDREGGSFYQEWSALFVMQGSQGDRIFFHYPRLQSMAGAEESAIPLDSKHKSGLARILLKGISRRCPSQIRSMANACSVIAALCLPHTR